MINLEAQVRFGGSLRLNGVQTQRTGLDHVHYLEKCVRYPSDIILKHKKLSKQKEKKRKEKETALGLCEKRASPTGLPFIFRLSSWIRRCSEEKPLHCPILFAGESAGKKVSPPETKKKKKTKEK